MAGESLANWLEYMGKKHGFITDGGAKTDSYSGAVYSQENSDGSEAQIVAGEVELYEGGVSASGALVKAKVGGVSTTIGGAEFKSGYIDDGEHQFAGTKVGVTGVKDEVDFVEALDLPETLVLKADGSAGTADAEISIRDDGFTLSGGATAVGGSVTLGTTGTGDQDETVRVGLSAGPSAAGRLHWGDADKDGNREFGFGFDYGPVSADIKTEDPLRFAMKQVNVGGIPVGMIASQYIDGNMTNDAIEATEEGVEAVSQAAQDLAERADQELEAARQEAERLAQEAAQGLRDAGEAAQDLADQAAQGLQDAGEAAQDFADDAAQEVQNAGEAARDLADQAAEGLSNLFSSDDE